MTKLNPGDRIDCRIKSAIIVSPYKDYDEIKTFEIISKDDYGYYLYVPIYFYLKDSKKIDKSQCKNLQINTKFLDENFVYIEGNMILRVSSILDGLICFNCKEFYSMAEPNQENGTLICYSCRKNPYR